MTLERLIALIAVGGLSIALGASEFARFRAVDSHKAIAERLDETAYIADTALRAVIPPETLSEADKSVYMVLSDNLHQGTAFVIDREKGILATAAHVAALLKFDQEEQNYAVINRHTGKPLRIRNAKLHSGYERFRKLVETYAPADPDSRILDPGFIRIYDLAHDGALLFVDPIDPETGANILGPNLPLADEDKLLALKPGDAIASIGFPIDSLTDNLMEESAASRVERNVISSMVAPIDIVEGAGNAQVQNLIVHRMAIAPGNSGGPLINRHGEVIGVNSHAYFSGFSNGDGLAQRADVILDLITPYREEDHIERIYFTEWAKRLTKWPKADDIFPHALYYRYNPDIWDDLELKAPLKELPVKEDPPFDVSIVSRTFAPTQRSFTVIADDLVKPADDAAEEDENELAAKQNPVFHLDDRAQYHTFKRRFRRDQHHVVAAYDYALDWETTGKCPLRIFYRRVGEDELKGAFRATVTSVHIKPDESENDDKFAVYQFITQRKYCQSQSNQFTHAFLSWDNAEETSPKAKETETETVASAMHSTASTITFVSNLKNSINCNIKAIGDEAQCMPTVKASTLTPHEFAVEKN